MDGVCVKMSARLIFACLVCGLVSLAPGLEALNAQTRSGASAAYYQLPSRDEYLRHLQVAYQEQLRSSGASSLTIEQRAARLLQQHQSDSGSPQGNVRSFQPVIPNRIPTQTVKVTLQDQDPFGGSTPDPFGPKPKPQENAGNQFDPFAEPPVNDLQKKNQFTPFSNEKPPTTEPAKQPTLTDPFADPVAPKQESSDFSPTQQGRDPVLPKDAIDSTSREPQLNPNQIIPAPTNPGQPNLGQGSVTPVPGVRVPEAEPSKPAIDYSNEQPRLEAPQRPAGIYQPPTQQEMPPVVVQPGQIQAYPETMSQVPVEVYQQPVYPQPLYQPAPAYNPPYQPIPAAQSHQHYPQSAIPAPPNMTMPAVPFAEPETPPQTADNVYQGVVPNAGAISERNREDALGCNSCGPNDCPNFYFSGFGGWTDLDNLEDRSGSRSFLADDGSAIGFALGRRNGRNLRTEVEFTARSNDILNFSNNLTLTGVNGEANAYSGMANAYWEFINVKSRYFKPYIGAGVGFAIIDHDLFGPTGQSIIPAGGDKDTSFAFQWMAGVNYKAYRNVDVFAEYRFFEADTYRIETTSGAESGQYTYQVSNIFAGIRWKF